MPGGLKHMRPIVLFGGTAPSIDICGVGHFPLHDGNHAVVNVNNIYIPKPSRIFVKRAAGGRRKNYSGLPQGPDGGTGGGPDGFAPAGSFVAERRSVGKPSPRR